MHLAGAIALIMLAAAGPAAAQTLASGAEIRGRVVDAETGQPLEGVRVVAKTMYWLFVSPLQMHAGEQTTLHRTEVVTGPDGEYRIPAWGPRVRPLNAILTDDSPRLAYFKPGYRILYRSNAPHGGPGLGRTSRWDGETIGLFRSTQKEWTWDVDFLE